MSQSPPLPDGSPAWPSVAESPDQVDLRPASSRVDAPAEPPPRIVPAGRLTDDDYFRLADHEDTVINHRLTWLLAGQPLLFLAYANVIAAKGDDPAELLAPQAYLRAKELIPWVGGLMALAVWFGALGGVLALVQLSRRREAERRAGVGLAARVLGLVPAVVVPLVFAVGRWLLGRT